MSKKNMIHAVAVLLLSSLTLVANHEFALYTKEYKLVLLFHLAQYQSMVPFVDGASFLSFLHTHTIQIEQKKKMIGRWKRYPKIRNGQGRIRKKKRKAQED